MIAVIVATMVRVQLDSTLVALSPAYAALDQALERCYDAADSLPVDAPSYEQLLDLSDLLLTSARAVAHEHLGQAECSLAYLKASLPDWNSDQIARLTGSSVIHVRRGAVSLQRAQRTVLVGRLAFWLAGSWTQAGVYSWFLRERHQLAGLTPLELLDEDAAGNAEALLQLARAGSAQTAS